MTLRLGGSSKGNRGALIAALAAVALLLALPADGRAVDVRVFHVPSAFGSDGALWFVDNGANVVGRIAVGGSLFGATSKLRRLGLKVSRKATTTVLAHGSRAFRSAGRATIRLAFSASVVRALARAHHTLKLSITATSSATGTTPRTSTRTLLLRP